jgi:hypothetical protein
MFNPRSKRRTGVEDTTALGARLMPKPIHFKESPQGQPLANIKSLDNFSLTNEIGNKENEKKKKKKARYKKKGPTKGAILMAQKRVDLVPDIPNLNNQTSIPCSTE